jgi:hypothetical protein
MSNIRVPTASRILRGATLLYTSSTPTDTALINDIWIPAKQYNSGVITSFKHRRYQFSVGEDLTIRDVEGKIVTNAMITGIDLTHTDLLSDQQFNAMGYANRDEWFSDWGELFEGRVWLIEIQPTQQGVTQ